MRAGLLGCGRVAANHAAAYRELPGVELVGVADPAPGRAAAFAADHGVPHAVADVTALLALGLDVLSVATPHPTHEELVLAAARAGVHVLCEKPIATDLAAADRMVAACEEAGVRFGVVFQRRFWPAARAIRAAIDDGTLGTPFLGHADVLLHREPTYYTGDPTRPAEGTGVLFTQAVHDVDLLCWYLGDCVEVTAAWATVRQPVTVEDTVVATLRFASGALATLSASTAVTPGLGTHVRVSGDTGATLALAEYPEGDEARLAVRAVPGQPVLASPFGSGAVADRDLPAINAALAPFHVAQIADFLDAVRHDREPVVTGRAGRRTLAVLVAIEAAAASGRPVPVDREESLV